MSDTEKGVDYERRRGGQETVVWGSRNQKPETLNIVVGEPSQVQKPESDSRGDIRRDQNSKNLNMTRCDDRMEKKIKSLPDSILKRNISTLG